MPGDPFQPVLPGQKLQIPAAAYNAFLAAAKAHRAHHAGDQGQARQLGAEPQYVFIKNNTGTDRGRFDAVGLGSVLFTPTAAEDEFKNGPAFILAEPTADHRGKFAVLAEPIKAGQIGRGIIAGITVCRLDADPGGNRFAEIEASQYDLKPNTYGSAQILWTGLDDSTQWAVVRLCNDPTTTQGRPIKWAKCQANWTYVGKGAGGTYPSAGGRGRVSVKECTDSTGATEIGAAFVLYLPNQAGGDPNLVAGDVVAYALTADETPVIVSAYMDDPIGTVKIFLGSSAQTRPGWVCMNGTQDTSKTRTGAAWSMVDKFALGECSDGQIGTTGGAETHDHGGATGNASPNTNLVATGITVDDHDDHSHAVQFDPGSPEFEPVEGGGTHLNETVCTSGVKDANSCASAAPAGVLGHTVNDPEHFHAVDAHAHDIAIASHMPPWRKLRYIERIDNSA